MVARNLRLDSTPVEAPWHEPFAMSFRSPRRLDLAALAALLLVAVGCDERRRAPAPAVSAEQVSTPPSSAPPLPASPIAAGQRAYEKYCQLCHAKDATGYAADNAPSLVSKTFLESASDDFIAAGIRLGRPNTAMAAYGKERGGPLGPAEIAEIIAFLRSRGPAASALPPPALGGDAARGAQLFEKNCQSCHGTAKVRGNAVHLHNPEFLAAASPAFIRYAILRGRAPTPMPAFQDTLPTQDVDDLVAWLVSMKPTQPTAPVQNPKVPSDLPLVINPKGAQATFRLREGRFVAADDVKKALDEKRRLVLIDARSPSDWIQFRIPGAVSLPYHEPSQLDRVPKDGTWVVAYCACPHHASGEVVDALRKRGYANTAVLDEGILVWRDRGYALVGEAVTAKGAKPAAGPASAAKPPSAKPSAGKPPAAAPPP